MDYYKIGLCIGGRYDMRLIVCDVNEDNQVIYWVARDVTGLAKRKILNPAIDSVGSGDILFNFHRAKQYNRCVIVEGVFDSLYVGDNAVATYGYGLKESHLYWLLQGNFDDVVICYDSDVSERDLERTAQLLMPFFKTRICKLTSGDPDEYPKDDLYRLIDAAPVYSTIGKINVQI